LHCSDAAWRIRPIFAKEFWQPVFIRLRPRVPKAGAGRLITHTVQHCRRGVQQFLPIQIHAAPEARAPRQ
jgi:hypothetical protein